jgi:hypothetical protein
MAKKSFRNSFSDAKKSGAKSFTWEGKSYSTVTAKEKAKKMSDKELDSVSNKAYEGWKGSLFSDWQKTDKKTGGTGKLKYNSTDKTKSKAEISDSYANEKIKRHNAKMRRKNNSKK